MVRLVMEYGLTAFEVLRILVYQGFVARFAFLSIERFLSCFQFGSRTGAVAVEFLLIVLKLLLFLDFFWNSRCRTLVRSFCLIQLVDIKVRASSLLTIELVPILVQLILVSYLTLECLLRFHIREGWRLSRNSFLLGRISFTLSIHHMSISSLVFNISWCNIVWFQGIGNTFSLWSLLK